MRILLAFLISFNLFASRQLFTCRMGSQKSSCDVQLRGMIDRDGNYGVIKMIKSYDNRVEIKRYEISGVLTSFAAGEIADGPFTHMRLQVNNSDEVLYFNFLVGYNELGSSHFVTSDNVLFRGECLSL